MERHGDEELTIRELAHLAGTTPRTIHYYTSEGLLPPPRGAKRGATYTSAHLARLRLIAALRDEGLSLSAIRNRLAPLDDAQALHVIEAIDAINARVGDEETSSSSVTVLGAIEAALAATLAADVDASDLIAMHDPAPGEGIARMDVPPPASTFVPSSPSAPSSLPRRRDRSDVDATHAPRPPQPGSAKGYIDQIRGGQLPDPSLAPSLPPPVQRVPPPRPLPQPRTATETPEAWHHFTIGDGIELRVRDDRYREAGGRLRAIVDAASSAARRYGLSATGDRGQSETD